jgi:hypothetical protein
VRGVKGFISCKCRDSFNMCKGGLCSGTLKEEDW